MIGEFKRRLRIEPSTRFERVLLASLILLLPLDPILPYYAGYSCVFVFVGLMGFYVLVWRPQSLMVTALNPAMLPAYAWILATSVMEFAHPDANHETMARVACMFAAAVLVATLCRDMRALRSALIAVVIAAGYIATIFLLTKYSIIRGASVANLDEANRLRGAAYTTLPIVGDLNGFSATMAQGAAVALALGFGARAGLHRWAFWSAAALCCVGAFLPLSRGGMAMVILAFAGVFIARRRTRSRSSMAFAVLLTLIILMMPPAAWNRLGVGFANNGGRSEGRVQIMLACLDAMDEVLPLGVGAGNYYTSWGLRPGLSRRGKISGPHNGFLAVTLYWGLVGLAALLAVLRGAWMCLPKRCALDGNSLALLALSLCLVVLLGVTHCLHDKNFTIGFGLLIGAKRWIWRNGEVSVPEVAA